MKYFFNIIFILCFYFYFLDEFKHDKVKKKKEASCTMKCLTKCTDRTVHLFPCLKDNNNIVNRISSMKSFRLDRISGFASFIKKKKKKKKNNKIGKDNDGSIKTTEEDGFNSSNGDEIAVSEIELREWSEPLNPALGIKEEEDEFSISSNSFMKTAPPAPRRAKDIENDRIEKRIELTSMNKNKSKTELEEIKHEMKQMKQQMKKQEMKQQKQQKQQKQEKERFQREKEEMERRHLDQIYEMQQTLKKMKTDNSLIVAKSALQRSKSDAKSNSTK